MKKMLILPLCIIAASMLYGAEERSTRQFTLGGMDYGTVRGVLNPALSEGGEITYDPVFDRVTLQGSHTQLQKAFADYRKYIESQPNIRVTLKSETKTSSNTRQIGYSPRSSVQKPKGRATRTGIEYAPGSMGIGGVGSMSVGAKNVGTTSGTTMFITVQSGLSAQLWRGEITVQLVPLQSCFSEDEWKAVSQTAVMGNGAKMAAVWQNTGVSLMVRPELMPGGLVRVTVFPQIAYPTQEGVGGTLRVMSLASTVMLKNGEEMELAGMIEKQKSRYLSIFGDAFFKLKDIEKVTTLKVKADVLGKRK